MKTLDNVKHPLGSEWSFWLFTNQKKNWADNLVKLATFDTVEDYWCLYHHMKVPSELNLGQEYLVFKKGIQPQWEDPANQSGGRWLIILDGEKAAHVDAIWLDTVLVLIGETFEHVDDVCGVVCNIRAKHRIVPSELNLGQEYLVFKKGIQPQWEDPANQSGGRWLIILDGEKAAHVDAIWLDTVLLLIGETFEHVDDVCGVVCNIRAKHRIAVWMRNCKAKPVCEVGKKLREHIPIKMHYYRHNQTKALFTV
ncbi:hypothetical protein B5X24_HaOG216029 [Helicoverpa armigera]|nr:hypothetical protein B5X24_HaOG216029 [Helicoverpa armigera]